MCRKKKGVSLSELNFPNSNILLFSLPSAGTILTPNGIFKLLFFKSSDSYESVTLDYKF